ncbi:MAG: beta-propeller fold lactonase family protein [Planctomycetota bacterium]
MMRALAPSLLLALVQGVAGAAPGGGDGAWVNWESPHVHPLELTPDGGQLLVVNTHANRLEVFAIEEGALQARWAIPTGLEPVSVRADGRGRAWVVTHVSDSVSVVDLEAGQVVATLLTDDEPADVVFAGQPLRAYVTCSQANTLMVFDPADLAAAPKSIAVDGEDPRALAVSLDGRYVYAAIFESGNRSTVLGGGSLFNLDFPPNVVSKRFSPYGGQNPPPNSAEPGGFDPPLAEGLPAPPPVGLIVKQNAAGQWRDDFTGDWTHLVSGPGAETSGRVPGWELTDHDVAIWDTRESRWSHARHLMNANMALAVHPKSGRVLVVGTDGTNEIRFEPKLQGRFLEVLAACLEADGSVAGVSALNPQLAGMDARVGKDTRSLAIGDPRGIAWSPDGSRGFVTGMGSNNVVVVDALGRRDMEVAPIPVGEGPTGIVYAAAHNRIFVLCKFESAVVTLDAQTLRPVASTPFPDPAPAFVRAGRHVLYGTQDHSGGGQIACASCHIDARTDRLAWDLGDPSGSVHGLDGRNRAADNPRLLESRVPGRGEFEPYHPMKGPMRTQTLQDIVGKEPLHWRGDRAGLEDFSGAFVSLQGGDAEPSAEEMAALKAFLATIVFPPNPYRNRDNSLPENLALPGHRSTGRFGPAGQPLPAGNARRGLQRFQTGLLDNGRVDCVTCHTLATGMGPDARLVEQSYEAIAPGARGERHHMLVAQDGSSNVTMKVPQLRSLYEQVGCDLGQKQSRLGFGFLHDGSVDTLARFVNESSFSLQSDQDTADMVAFLLAFSGSDLEAVPGDVLLRTPGTASGDSHAAVGQQRTFAARPAGEGVAWLRQVLAMAESGAVDVMVAAREPGAMRLWMAQAGGAFHCLSDGKEYTGEQVLGSVCSERPRTVTVVPRGYRPLVPGGESRAARGDSEQ